MIEENTSQSMFVDVPIYRIFENSTGKVKYIIDTDARIVEPEEHKGERATPDNWGILASSNHNVRVSVGMVVFKPEEPPNILFEFSPKKEKALKCAQLLDEMVNNNSDITLEDIEAFVML